MDRPGDWHRRGAACQRHAVQGRNCAQAVGRAGAGRVRGACPGAGIGVSDSGASVVGRSSKPRMTAGSPYYTLGRQVKLRIMYASLTVNLENPKDRQEIETPSHAPTTYANHMHLKSPHTCHSAPTCPTTASSPQSPFRLPSATADCTGYSTPSHGHSPCSRCPSR